MPTSIFDLFTIGIGPSSSHTVGPMRAAQKFVDEIEKQEKLEQVQKITIELYGSLALTDKGHGTDRAILMGLEGELPETVDPDLITQRIQKIAKNKQLLLFGKYKIAFNPAKHLIYHLRKSLPLHTNGMRFTAFDKLNKKLYAQDYYSIGGGFVITGQEKTTRHKIPYRFASAKELHKHCQKNKLSISEVVLANENTLRSETEIRKKLLTISKIMEDIIRKGCTTKEKILPGILKLERRAPKLYQKLLKRHPDDHHLYITNWISVYALAVAEENAAGGRIVTIPTNGAAGVIPAVLQYYKKFYKHVTKKDIITFLLTAGALGLLYKFEASISGAEVGCQGEIGVACSMAAGALTAVLGGNEQQIEKAAVIAMEHNLGLTCDPIACLVQIPCIERNAMAAVRAIHAATLAITEGKEHRVSLDEIILTMLQTGKDMKRTYKETSKAGLARYVC